MQLIEALFPAYAGVIPHKAHHVRIGYAFPRIRGGDPAIDKTTNTNEALFPAYAGVILMTLPMPQILFTFPRIRGGDPQKLSHGTGIKHFSPHTRG